MIIGRDHELEQLGGLVGALGSGARVLLIEREAGIGKTTIWEAAWPQRRPPRLGFCRHGRPSFKNRFHSSRSFTLVP